MLAGSLILSAALAFADPSPAPDAPSASPQSSGLPSSSAMADPKPQPPISAERQRTLIEMRDRRIVPSGANDWNDQDSSLLDHIHRAETSGAIEMLRQKAGSLQGYAVPHRFGNYRGLWLTKAGYERYASIRAQGAIRYFEDQGTPFKFIFQLKNVEAKSLFDDKGLLTPAGDELYNQILAGKTVRWMDYSGQVTDNAPLTPESVTK